MKVTTSILVALCALGTVPSWSAEPVKPAHQNAAKVCKRVQETAQTTLEARKSGHNDKAGDKARLGSDSTDPMFIYAIDVAYDSDVNKTGIGQEAYDYCMLHKASS